MTVPTGQNPAGRDPNDAERRLEDTPTPPRHDPPRRFFGMDIGGEQIGLLLVILGGLALLSNVGLFRGLGNVFGALLFAAGGALLVRYYDRKPERTVALIFGFAMFGLAGAAIGGRLAGFFFLGLLGLGFAAIYSNDRRQWWSLIPAGVLASLAVVAGLESLFPRYDVGPVLFLGFAATFALLTRLPERPQSWAIYPAIACAIIALMALTVGGSWLLPLILIAGGVYLLTQRRREPVVNPPTAEAGSSFAPPTPPAPSAPAPSAPSPSTPSPSTPSPSTPAATSDEAPDAGPDEERRG